MSRNLEPTERRFRGKILGVGSTSGVRIVVGMWERSPFGPFTDVFLEQADGSSVLLAPDELVAAYVSGQIAKIAPDSVKMRASSSRSSSRSL